MKKFIHPIKKVDFACSVRSFTTLVLFLEKDKEYKEKNKYIFLMIRFMDQRYIYKHVNFNKNLNELIDINSKIYQIIIFSEALAKDINKESDYDKIK